MKRKGHVAVAQYSNAASSADLVFLRTRPSGRLLSSSLPLGFDSTTLAREHPPRICETRYESHEGCKPGITGFEVVVNIEVIRLAIIRNHPVRAVRLDEPRVCVGQVMINHRAVGDCVQVSQRVCVVIPGV